MSEMMDRSMKMERINLYLEEQVEEQLSLSRGRETYAILAMGQHGIAYVEEGEGISELELDDTESEQLYLEIIGRIHAHRLRE